jgi:hypothetical protein
MNPPHEFKVMRVRECAREPALIDTPQQAVGYWHANTPQADARNEVVPHPPVRVLKIEADGDRGKGSSNQRFASWGVGLSKRGSGLAIAFTSHALVPGSSNSAPPRRRWINRSRSHHKLT